MVETKYFFLSLLNQLWFTLINDPIKAAPIIAAFASTISAFAAIGGLIIGWRNFNKDTTRIYVVVNRANNGPLILQNPKQEFLLFEVYNQGISPVVINEVGIQKHRSYFLKKREFRNLVDLPHAYLEMKGHENAIGSIECVGLPGTIPARTTGIFLLNYSVLKETAINYQKQNILPESLNFVGVQRVISTYKEFQKLQDDQTNNLNINPYVLTGSGNYFIGKKAIIRLGNLGDVV